MSLQIGLPLMFLAALLQATVFAQLRPLLLGGAPDLVLVLVMAWSILDPDREGMWWAFFGGLMLDLFSGTPLGLTSALMIPIAFVVGASESAAYRANLALPALLWAGASLGYHLGLLLLLRIFAGVALPFGEALLRLALPSIVLNVLLIIPAFKLLEGPYSQLHPRQVRL